MRTYYLHSPGNQRNNGDRDFLQINLNRSSLKESCVFLYNFSSFYSSINSYNISPDFLELGRLYHRSKTISRQITALGPCNKCAVITTSTDIMSSKLLEQRFLEDVELNCSFLVEKAGNSSLKTSRKTRITKDGSHRQDSPKEVQGKELPC